MTHPSRNLAFIPCRAASASCRLTYLTKPKPFDLPEILSVITFASRTCPKGINAFLSFSSVVNLERPLTKSLGVVSGGTLLTSASSPKMEDGGVGVGEGPEEEVQKAARSTDERVEERGRRRRSREEEDGERAMVGTAARTLPPSSRPAPGSEIGRAHV